jgi:transposase
MKKYSKFIGLDVHKTDIVVGTANADRGEAGYYGTIENAPHAYLKLAKKLSKSEGEVLFCYEAGPCGYEVYRQLTKAGYDCIVIAPSLIPKKSGDRIKTDRRDAVSLARLLRAGELTPIWVPDKEQEAMRDLTRAREDIKTMERQSRQRLGGFLLRHGKVYPGRSKWTKAYFRWLESLRFETAAQQIVFQEYIDIVKDAQQRVAAMEEEMRKALTGWTLKPVVDGLMALRGVDLIAAMTIIAELGDITRFESPRQLMAHLGLVPSEHSSGERQKRGGITKTGNGHVRRILVEGLPGAIDCLRVRQLICGKRQRRPARLCRRSRGRHKKGCAAGTGIWFTRANYMLKVVRRWPGNWLVLSGPLHARSWGRALSVSMN